MKRNKFNLGSYKLLTGDMGQLYPCGLVEVLPGDTVQHHANALVRLSPMAAPVMHGMDVRMHHFFVPHRIVWDKFEEFITGGPDGMNTDTVPTMVSTGTPGDLLDYLGIPPVAGVEISELPVRVYNAIYNNWYRDQDLCPKRAEDDVTIAKISWAKDYFTTARPWPQKGPEITLPLDTLAPVHGLGYTTNSATGPVYDPNSLQVMNPASDFQQAWFKLYDQGAALSAPRVYADLHAALSVDDLRRVFALQRMQEARARYGSRYSEYLAYLGVACEDARLDEPEYLGGGKVTISVSEVLQTAPETEVDDASPYGVGDLYGHGIGAMRTSRYRRFIPEHGYVMSLLSVRPKSLYADGIQRTFLRRDKEDFWQRELEHIGQQQVLVNEVYASATEGQNVFGYADRYAEYRMTPSEVHGEFRELLNYWHLGREFTAKPVLNQSFVECVPSKRIFNVQTEHVLWMMVQHHMVARRMVTANAEGRIL